MKKKLSDLSGKNRKRLPIWAIILIIITSIDIFLFAEYFCIKIYGVIGFLLGLLIMVDILIWGILNVAFGDKRASLSIIDTQELDNAARLLRYATTVLSFLSLMTTANGMKFYVFDREWKAYLGSFAVQSILVVFSLLLCHFYVVIGSFSHFSNAGKALMLGALTLFFATALIVSSSFSYAYISGNAYKNTWPEDSETLIQEYLIRETNVLKKQNKHLGKLFLENIENDIQRVIEKDIKNYEEHQKLEANKKISNFHMENYTEAQDDLEKIEITSTINNLKNDRNARPEQLAVIQESYDMVGVSIMQQAFSDYSTIVQDNKDLQGIDFDIIGEQLMKVSRELQKIITDVDNAITDVAYLETGFYINDINPIKTTFKSTARKFSNFVKTQKDNIDELIHSVNTANLNNEDTDGLSISEQIEIIRRTIYLLNSQQTDNLDLKIQELVNKVTELLENLSSDVVTTESVSLLTLLTEKINEYGKALSLANKIQIYVQDDMNRIYISSENRDASIEIWRNLRDADFNEFFSMLHELPDPLFLDEAYQSKYKLQKYRNTADVLKEAESLRRDLLGELTDFEKALNYFKYDFRKMAAFSAFIAVFLDMGAFLTGCFLYSTRQIKSGQAECESEETRADEEGDDSTEVLYSDECEIQNDTYTE